MPRNEKWEQLSNVFVNWLISDMDTELPESCLPYLNHKLLISMFSKEPYINRELNKLLNNKHIYSIDIKELALFIKQLMKVNKIDDRKIWWFSNLEFSEVEENKRVYKLLSEYEKQILADLIDQGVANDVFNPFTEKNDKPKKKKLIKKTDIVKKSIILDNVRNLYLEAKPNSIRCKQCGLYNNQQVTFDSNLKTFDPGEIDILFIAEAPGETEVEKGVPLIGRSGQLLREYINKYLKNTHWFMTNVCLCRPENNRTPNENEIKSCSFNLNEIIDLIKPKLIVALGNTSMSSLNISGPVNKARGIHNYKNYNVYSTVHPSALLRTHKNEIYDEDFNNIRDLIENTKMISNDIVFNGSSYTVNDDQMVGEAMDSIKQSAEIVDKTIRIPNEYYNYDLIDIQKVMTNNGLKILYIFRDKEDKKVYFEAEPLFYYHYKYGPGKHIEDINTLEYAVGKPRYNNSLTYYEADLAIDSRHSIDYYLNLENESNYTLKVMYIDIEVLSDGSFPKPEDAEFPVNLITFHENEKFTTFVLSEKLDVTDIDTELVYFNTEEELLLATAKKITESDIDIVTAWNVLFDIPYIHNRMKRLGLDVNLLSPLHYDTDIDIDINYINIPGLVVVDLLLGYKNLTEGSRESYSLDFIANEELGEGKSHKGSAFNKLWFEDKIESIKYNILDVDLIQKIDAKLDIIGYLNELRKTSYIPWRNFDYTSRVIDSLISYFARKNNVCLRNKSKDMNMNDEKFGAYVYNPVPGMHDNVYIVDFSKQYPSTIQSLNISPTTLYAVMSDRNDVRFVLLNDDTKNYNVIIDPIYSPKPVSMTLDQLKRMIKDNDLIFSLAGGMFQSQKNNKSIFHTIIDHLSEKRNFYKKLYKKEKLRIYENKQRAFKFKTNSIYGYFGLETSRMFNVHVVNNITLSARHINKLCALSANKLLTDGLDDFDFNTFYNEIVKEYVTKYWDKDIDKPFILAGDTDSFFIKIVDKEYSSWKEAKERGDKILEFLDKIVVKDYLPRLLNLSTKEVRWTLEYQGIVKAYLLNVKKKYALKYYHGDYTGVVIKGIEIRRSDFPRLTREYLSKLIDLIIVEEKSHSELNAFIKQSEEEFTNRIKKFDKSVARPISFGKKLDDYKKVPAYVVAMEFWNKFMNNVFNFGSKGYVFKVKFLNPPEYIKDIINELCTKYKLSKLEWLAVPEDYDNNFPEWIVIDQKYMLDFAWKHRVEALVPEEKEEVFTFDL